MSTVLVVRGEHILDGATLQRKAQCHLLKEKPLLAKDPIFILHLSDYKLELIVAVTSYR